MTDDEIVDLPQSGDDIVDLPKESPQAESTLYSIATGAVNLPIGYLKGIGQTGYNIGHIISPARIPRGENVPALKPTPGAQTAGWSLERATELVGPTWGIGKGMELVENAPTVAKILGRAGLESGSAAGVTGLQTGSWDEAKKAGLITGGLTLLGPGIAWGMGKYGNKIQMSTIRPGKKDWIDGFDPKILPKLKLKGNLGQSYQQVEGKLASLRNERKLLFDPSTQSLNLDDVFNQARAQLQQEVESLKHAGTSKRTIEAFDQLRDDIYSSLPNGNPLIDIGRAENAKEAIGLLGAWTYGRTDLDANSLEKVANILYPKLRDAIERAMPQGAKLRAINQEMRELLPLRNAMLSRIPVEERNRIFSLADVTAMIPSMVTGRIDEAALLALTRLQKSARVGNWLVRNAQSATGASAGIGKLLSGILSRSANPMTAEQEEP